MAVRKKMNYRNLENNNAKYYFILFGKKMYELGLEDLSESQVALPREIKFILLRAEFFHFFTNYICRKSFLKMEFFTSCERTK
ncbi:hypothetical protein VIGAN_05103700 [Vigna angularis var. angularis]|uniref:Uncharacterized protein n=1 Tax=Vigna angularis var. angularis TaxID=157739 RepID=A0A0S3S4B7_PHAAN|nr:hypothetical protein VIGAN_05103700 [Vigna angularis var. angularis]